MQPMCDVSFPLTGDALPLDHGYPLFGSTARVVPALHDAKEWGIHPVRGDRDGRDNLRLSKHSHLTLRVPTTDIGQTLPLAGQTLEVDGYKIACGAPRVWQLRPAAAIRARMVVVASVIDIAAAEEEQRKQLVESIRRKLAHLPLQMDAERVEIEVGRRHVTRIGPARPRQRSGKDVVDRDIVVGFQVTLSGLEAPASIAIQSAGIGGRRHMGCGLFVPLPRVALA